MFRSYYAKLALDLINGGFIATVMVLPIVCAALLVETRTTTHLPVTLYVILISLAWVLCLDHAIHIELPKIRPVDQIGLAPLVTSLPGIVIGAILHQQFHWSAGIPFYLAATGAALAGLLGWAWYPTAKALQRREKANQLISHCG